jgi:hypothetical protein
MVQLSANALVLEYRGIVKPQPNVEHSAESRRELIVGHRKLRTTVRNRLKSQDEQISVFVI